MWCSCLDFDQFNKSCPGNVNSVPKNDDDDDDDDDDNNNNNNNNNNNSVIDCYWK
jgi:hypothetical protein